jgi:hypothetical protein
MASKTTVELIDDIDGSKATETVEFGLDGRLYSIDLKEKNAKALRKALEPFAAVARKTGGRTATKASTSVSDPAGNAAIRQWAQEAGYEIGERGRISEPIRQAYAAR